MTVVVRYVTGAARAGAAEDWRTFPSEGVDRVEIQDPSGTVILASASLYWLVREDATWVAGAASVGYDPNPLTEIVFDGAGGQVERRRPFLPDLQHADLKLGHWWPGTADAPVHG